MSAYRRRSDCRLCGSNELTLVLALEPTPPANAFVSADELELAQACYPLDVHHCHDCGHVQLLDVVDPRILFENYVYVSSTSPVFVEHFKAYAASVASRFNVSAGDLVCDIGSNDGVLLRAFSELGARVLGVDPAKDIAKAATDSGIPTIADFFSQSVAESIVSGHGKATVVTANNVFAHADDLAGIVRGVHAMLQDNGVFVFEVSYLLDVFEQTLFDTIYHEHVAYHSVIPLRRFFADHGMVLVDAERIAPHGGSLRGVAALAGTERSVSTRVDELVQLELAAGLDRAETFQRWANQIAERGAQLNEVLATRRAAGQRIAGFGAPAKATTLMYHYGLDAEVFEFIIDDSPLKQGLYSPGLHVPVVPMSALAGSGVTCLVILAWNFADSIIKKCEKFLEDGGTIIVPLPEVRVVEHGQQLDTNQASS